MIMEDMEKTIQDIKLLKVEKDYKPGSTPTYFYNLKLSGIKKELLLETKYLLDAGIVGKKITYTLDENNNVSNFMFI